jgi:hypothetical protein
MKNISTTSTKEVTKTKQIELSAEEYLHFCLINKQDIQAPPVNTVYYKNSVIITCDEKYLESLGY